MTTQYGIFNDESADYTEAEAVEAGFYSLEEAEAGLRQYGDDEDLVVHAIEELEEDEDEDDEDGEEDEDE